jgi:hypothetical protein
VAEAGLRGGGVHAPLDSPDDEVAGGERDYQRPRDDLGGPAGIGLLERDRDRAERGAEPGPLWCFCVIRYAARRTGRSLL